MKDFRFWFHTLLFAPKALFCLIPKARKTIAKGADASTAEKYGMLMEIAENMRRYYRVRTYVFGSSNIPSEDGFVCYINHQGRYDSCGVIAALGRMTGSLWEDKSASELLMTEVAALIDAATIDRDNPIDCVRGLKKAMEQVKAGRNMLIYPEGYYDDNHNNLQEFKTGCFQVSLRTKTDIVPVVLFDSYKVMNTNSLKKMETQVHFLPPIHYAEYAGMSREELAGLVKCKMQEKLDDIKSKMDTFDTWKHEADQVLE